VRQPGNGLAQASARAYIKFNSDLTLAAFLRGVHEAPDGSETGVSFRFEFCRVSPHHGRDAQ